METTWPQPTPQNGQTVVVSVAPRVFSGGVAGAHPDCVRAPTAAVPVANPFMNCRRVGRDPCDVEVSAFLVLYKITNVPLAGPILRLGARFMTEEAVARNVLAGSAEDITKKIRTFVDAGATHIIMNIQPPYDRELLRRFAEEVMPSFR